MTLDLLPLACATCANSFQEGGGDAAGWAILFMLGLVVPTVGATGIFLVRIIRRERATLDPKYFDR